MRKIAKLSSKAKVRLFIILLIIGWLIGWLSGLVGGLLTATDFIQSS